MYKYLTGKFILIKQKGEKMKKLFIVSILLVAMILPVGGCATLGNNNGNWQDNVPRLKADIFMFSKLATRIALTEAKMQADDVILMREYLVTLKDLLSEPGHPNFTGARILVEKRLPQKYHVYGFTIIDVLERYLQTANLDVSEDQEIIVSLVSSGINGALEAVQEFNN